jgi:hypothetical protein
MRSAEDLDDDEASSEESLEGNYGDEGRAFVQLEGAARFYPTATMTIVEPFRVSHLVTEDCWTTDAITYLTAGERRIDRETFDIEIAKEYMDGVPSLFIGGAHGATDEAMLEELREDAAAAGIALNNPKALLEFLVQVTRRA